jgi:hypothetical protein
MILTDRHGVRIGDIFADTQVVDAKVLSSAAEQIATRLGTVPEAPPGSSPSATRDGSMPPTRPAA